MQIVKYAWIHIVDGKIYAVRPEKTPALIELKRGDDFKNALRNLQVSEWRLAPDQTIPDSGEAEIELRRDEEYEHPQGKGASVQVEGEGTFAERVWRIQRRYEVNGWDLIEVFSTMNRGSVMIFTKPEGAPDIQPFFEPNVKC